MADAVASIPPGVEAPAIASPTTPSSPVDGEQKSEDKQSEETSSSGLEEVAEFVGADATYDFLTQLGENATSDVDKMDSAFVMLENAMMNSAALRAEALGIPAEDFQELSDFIREHPSLKDVLAEWGSTKSTDGFDALVRAWQDHQLVQRAKALQP